MKLKSKTIYVNVFFILGMLGCGYQFPGGGEFPEGVSQIGI
jgi:hypothetical protein